MNRSSQPSLSSAPRWRAPFSIRAAIADNPRGPDNSTAIVTGFRMHALPPAQLGVASVAAASSSCM
jgi:hypothetical protein